MAVMVMTAMMIMMATVMIVSVMIPCESVHLELSCGKRFLPLVKLEAHLDINYDDDDDDDDDDDGGLFSNGQAGGSPG